MKRFGRVLKLDFVEGRKSMMWGALCMLLLYLFFFWFAHNLLIHDSRMDYVNDPEVMQLLRMKEICGAVGAFGVMAMFIYLLIATSTLYRGEQKKQQRIAWLMLPASNLEKFTSRWIYLLVFSLVGGVLPFFIADLIHMAYLGVADLPVMAATDDVFSVFPHMQYKGDTWISIVKVYTFLVMIHSFYLLGGVFFKKYHFIATSAVLVLGLAMVFTITNAFHLYVFLNRIDIFIYPVLVILFTWLAYYLFCRWQVVTHKFANV